MYENNYDNELCECAIIKVEQRNGVINPGTIVDGYHYNVLINEAENTIMFIKELFHSYNMSDVRVYITGFKPVTKNNVWDKSKITKHILNVIKKQTLKQNEVTMVQKK